MNVVRKGRILHAYTQNAIGPYEDMKFNAHLAYFDEVFFFPYMVKLTLSSNIG